MDSPSNLQSNNKTISMAKRAALYIGILAFALVLLLFLGSGQASAEDVSGDITDDNAVWASDGVYNLTGDVYIYGNLTIEDNVTVVAQGYYWINVMDGGSLTVLGTEALGVTFNNESGAYWGGLDFSDGSSGSIEYASIYNSYYGAYIENVPDLTLSNLVINYTQYGLYYYLSDQGTQSLALTNTTILNIEYYAVYAQSVYGNLTMVLSGLNVTNSGQIVAIADAGWVDVHITDSVFYNVNSVLDLDANVGATCIQMTDVSVENAGMVIDADNYNGSMEVSLSNVSTHYVEVLGELSTHGYNYSGELSVSIDQCSFNYSWAGFMMDADLVGSFTMTATVVENIGMIVGSLSPPPAVMDLEISQGDVDIVFEDLQYDWVYAPIVVNVGNGSLDVSMVNVRTNNTNQVAYFSATDYTGSGRIDLEILGCEFLNTFAGISADADIIGSVTIEDTTVTWPSMVTGVSLPLESGIAFLIVGETYTNDTTVATFENMTVEGYDIAFVVDVMGSLDVTMLNVVTNDTEQVAIFYANGWQDLGVLNLVVSGCQFTNTTGGVMAEGDQIGGASVTDTQVSGYPLPPAPPIQPGPVAFMIVGFEANEGVVEVTFQDIVIESMIAGFVVGIQGNLTLTLDTITSNYTLITGMFYAENEVQNAVMSINMIDVVITNSSMGLMFGADIIEIDPLAWNNVFQYIDGQALMMSAHLGDIVINMENFMMENGGGISVYVDFGNIEVNVIDSVLGGSGSGALLDLQVGSNTLDNGFITLNIQNSTFKEAEFGIMTVSEELSPIDMVGSQFINITAEAMNFDVRTNDVLIDLTEVVMSNCGAGLVVYANDGDLVLNIVDSQFGIAQNEGYGYGAWLEVNSATNSSTMDILVNSSVFEGGYYGIYAITPNGGDVLIQNSEFLGQSTRSFTFDSLFGDVNMSVLDSVFDGSTAEDSVTLYTVEQTEYEFLLYGRTGAWNATYASNGGVDVELPFAFEYNGVEYTEVTFHEDGYLRFDSGNRIRPVGDVELGYSGDHFYGYKVADDLSYVLFNWYAYNADTGTGESNSFQVILYANGEIRFNYAYMDNWGAYNNFWGLRTSGGYGIDYNMYDLIGQSSWYMDLTSWVFTPHDMSEGSAISVTSEFGDVSMVVDNSVLTSYFGGGIAVTAYDGDMDFAFTENDVSYMYAPDVDDGPMSIIDVLDRFGEMTYVMEGNSFYRIWSVASFAVVLSSDGGAHSFLVNDNVFDKVYYGVYTAVYIESYIGEGDNNTLDVVADFTDNTMTDAFGLGNTVFLYVDEGNWTVSVEQTFSNNVMEQELYEGAFPAQNYYEDDMPGAIVAELGIVNYDWTVVNITIEHTVVVTDNVVDVPLDVDGVYIRNMAQVIQGDVDSKLAITVTGNEITVIDTDGVDIEAEMNVDMGTINTDASMIIQNNQIFDGWLESTGVEITYNIYAGEYYDMSGFEMATDLTAVLYISVTGNLLEGLDEGIDVYAEFWQDNSVGTWNVDATVNLDNNRVLNTTYAVDAYLGGGSWFGENYWPYYDEVAVATFNMDYLLTVDNNVIYSIGGDEDSIYDAIIYVDVEAWAEVDPSTHFTEAYANVNGAVSVSNNQIVQENADLVMLYLLNWYAAEKTGVLDLVMDIAVEDNTYEILYAEDYPWWYSDYMMVLEDYAELYGNFDIPTDEPTVTADIVWTVTGNQMVGLTDFGLLMIQTVEIDSPSCNITQDLAVEISGNTIDGAIEGGLGFSMNFMPDNYDGYVVLNLDLAIENNIITMAVEDESGLGGRPSSGMAIGPGESDDGIDINANATITVRASVSGNTITGAAIGASIGEGFYVGELSLPPMSEPKFDVVMLVENNFISGSMTGLIVNGGNISIANNNIEASSVGIEWSDANGDVTGNTVYAPMGISLEYPNEVSVVGNTVTFMYDGIYVADVGSGHDWTFDPAVLISGNVLTYANMAELMGGLNYVGGGVVLMGVGNIAVMDNTVESGNYGIYVDGAYNLTVSGNELLNSYNTGIYLRYVYLGWTESNVIMYAGNFGLNVYDGCWYLTIGNNTIADNAGTGIEVSESNSNTVMYNNEVTGNGWGIDVESTMWIIDAATKVARNGVWFDGDIEIRSGGSLMVQDVSTFDYDGDELLVMEGGLLSASNSAFTGESRLQVFGTLWANLCMFEGYDIYLGPTSEAEIRGGTIMEYEWAGIHVDGSAPVIADNLIFSYEALYGILVEGENAAPSIVSNIIALNQFGIYARGTDMGGVYDNLIALNWNAGILAEDATGRIHDNILLANKVEILLRNSDVSVEDNEIGYTNLFQVLANYAPLLGHFMSTGDSEEGTSLSEDPVAALESVLDVPGLGYEDILTWIKAHNGIWAEDSKVQTSGNVYGLLNYALYAVRSEVHFEDDIRTIVLEIPHANDGEIYTYSLNVYMLNGIYASGSQVWITGSTIEVLDDAVVLDGSEAWVEGATLMAGDFDYFLFGGSEAYNVATNYSKAKIEDSHSLNEGTWLTLTFMDKGEAAANISVVIKNAKGEIVFNGTTDADGKVRVLLAQYSYTSEGKDDGFNPYTIIADFESGEKSTDVVLDQSYQELTIEGEEESDMGAILAVVGVLVIILLIVAAVVVMRRRK